MNKENKQRFDQAISRLQHALDDTDSVRKVVAEYLQEIAQSIEARRLELANLNRWKENLDEQIKQRQLELEWNGTRQEYVIRQLRAAIQAVTWEKPHYGQRHVGKWYNDQFQAAVTRAINRRIDDLLEISRVRLSNAQVQEHSQLVKESRRKLAGELRAARKRLRELKTMESQHPNGFAPVPAPLLDADQIIRNGTAVPNKSGVYFIWEGPLVAYVGQSINLAQRLLNHPQLQPDDKISYLLIDRSELFYHEAFYIGLCRPSRNGSGYCIKKYQKNGLIATR
jgi:hypothetical protein